MNADIFYIVCEYVEPNPVEYCKLALVSKHLYQVFTSDSKWQALNVAGVESDIIGSFLKSLRLMRAEQSSKWLMEHCWDKASFSEHAFTYTGTNLFALLGAHLNTSAYEGEEIPVPSDAPQFVPCLLNLRPFALAWLEPTPDAVMTAVSKCGCALKLAPQHMLNSKELVLAAVSTGCNHYCECDCLQETCGCCSVNYDSTPLQFATPRLKRDHQVLEIALSKSWRALEFAKREMQSDQQIIRRAVDQCGLALQFCQVKSRDLVLRAVSNCGAALEFSDLANDREVVLAAINAPPQQLHSNGHTWKNTLKHVSRELKKDPEILRLALDADGNELANCSVPLKRDPEIVLRAVKSRGSAITYASRIRPLLPEIILEASRTYAYALCVASSKLKSDHEFILKLVSQGDANNIADAELTYTSRKLAEVCVSKAPFTFDCFPVYKTDREFVLSMLARTQNVEVFRYCAVAHREEFLIKAIQICPRVILELPWTQQTRDLVLEAVRRDGSIYSSMKLCIEYRRDKELAEVASLSFKSAWCFYWA